MKIIYYRKSDNLTLKEFNKENIEIKDNYLIYNNPEWNEKSANEISSEERYILNEFFNYKEI